MIIFFCWLAWIWMLPIRHRKHPLNLPENHWLAGKNYGPGRTEQAAKPADFSVVSHNFSTGPAGRC
jgi:hypothetical protein